MKLGDSKVRDCALRPDAQAFDEIRIITVPRYKESGLSGDEWRISAEVQFYRKGILLFSTARRNVETACGFLYADLMSAIDNGKAYFAGDGIFCDQEGCSRLAAVRYKMHKLYSRGGLSQNIDPTKPMYRHFCNKHKQGGNCGLEDADSNYFDPESI